MPRTLITGGAGFLGSHLCDYLLDKGHEILCMDNLITGSLNNIKHINIGSGVGVSIRNLANTVKNIVGYSGKILYDTSMPDGTPKKVLDISKIRKLGWEPSIGLKQGLEDTYKWFLRNEKYICKEQNFIKPKEWLFVTAEGKPKITINKKTFIRKPNETVFIPKGAIHRIQNEFKKPVKIIEVQLGSILKETDIVRYKDVYGRVK